MKNLLIIFILFLLLVVACSEGFHDLGCGYSIDYGPGGPFKAIYNPINSVIVTEHILDFAFDSVYIIAAQRPFDSVPECTDKDRKYIDCRRAILKTSTFKQYWIIDKRKESVFITEEKKHSNAFGPFNKEEYLFKRKELNIPESLVLKADQ